MDPPNISAYAEVAFARAMRDQTEAHFGQISHVDPALGANIQTYVNNLNLPRTLNIAVASQHNLMLPENYHDSHYATLGADYLTFNGEFADYVPSGGLLVDTLEKVDAFLLNLAMAVEELGQGQNLAVAVDSEFFTSIASGSVRHPHLISTVQFAFHRCCVVLDLIALATHPARLADIFNYVYGNDRIIVVEHDLHGDSDNFRSALIRRVPPGTLVDFNFGRFVDLQIPYFASHFNVNEQHPAPLSGMLFNVCGFRLCKRESCSYWPHRPLRDDMITYAGLDGLAALLLYDVLKAFLNQGNQ